MSELESTAKPPHSKTTEFCRWLIVVTLIAIAASGYISFLAAKSIPLQEWMLIIPIWICIPLGEGWVQFHKPTSRLIWLTAGILTGVCLSILDTGEFSIKRLLVMIVPAGFEWFAARRERSRAWIWLVVTPAIYASIGMLVDRSREIVPNVMSRLNSELGISLPTSGDYAELATAFAALLLTRAIAGSFIASRKPETPSMSEKAHPAHQNLG